MLISFKNRPTTIDENSSSTSSCSSSVVASNVDLLIQILLCLPVKSLLVFKSVSKQWLYLISDPSFIQNHYLQNCLSTHGLILLKKSLPGNNNPRQHEFVFLDRRKITNDVPFKTLTFVDNTTCILIEQSCNGLLLCFSKSNSSDEYTSYIYNPSTKRYRILPPSQIKKSDRLWVCSFSLAFDPLKSLSYETICIWSINPFIFQFEIYSSKTNSWRLSGDAFHEPMYFFYESGVFWNGSLHWIPNEFLNGDLGKMFGLYFDIGKELVKKMPLPLIPNEFRENFGFKYFGACRGHLHFIYSLSSCTTRFDILEMDTDYTGWSIKYHVDLEGLKSSHQGINPDLFKFSVLLVEDEELPKIVLVILSDMVIISYDLKEKSFKKIHDLQSYLDAEGSTGQLGYFCNQYNETLAFV